MSLFIFELTLKRLFNLEMMSLDCSVGCDQGVVRFQYQCRVVGSTHALVDVGEFKHRSSRQMASKIQICLN
jgi:hypothetical protein